MKNLIGIISLVAAISGMIAGNVLVASVGGTVLLLVCMSGKK